MSADASQYGVLSGILRQWKRERAVSALITRTQQTGAFDGERIVRFGNIIAKNWVQERPQGPRDPLYLVIDGVFMRCPFQILIQYEVIT